MILDSAILEVSLKNLKFNYNYFNKLNKKLLVGVTLKANAYGIGDKKVFSLLYREGCKNFFVATINEGLNLRKTFKKGKIYILNGIQGNKKNLFKKNNLIPIVNSYYDLKIIKNFGIIYGIHVDTGINRLGISFNNIKYEIFEDKNICIVMSHLASADKPYNPYNYNQKSKFENIIANIGNKKIVYSLSNSYGTRISNKFYFDLIRPGIGIYGGHNNTKLKKIVKPVVKLKAKILQIKEINKNEFIGYNQTFKTKNKCHIAVIGIGYADGVSRLLSNKGFVYYKKKRFNIIGRVSMDTITINITKYEKIFKIGEFVELINYEHGIDQLAKQCNTISNEILTSISKRVKRIYV